MSKSVLSFLITVLIVGGVVFALNYSSTESNYVPMAQVTAVAEHDAYNKMMDVLMSPRCINCHPNDHIPKQADDGHPHYFGMSRGVNNLGYQATKCTTCHQTENNDYSGVPGAPEWSLAPDKMKWEGLTRSQIARSMLNKANNGNRSLEELEHHLTEHELVLWAWNPGVNADGVPREPPPVPLAEYKAAVKEWIEHGAIVPED
ncbi:MAG: hypothetical protein ABJN95_16365 [Maribacter sp.]|uniref:hypothetical protein n=1 Tax=Maribacter sp. TaxID=1897614 RepID=UPI00329A5E3E